MKAAWIILLAVTLSYQTLCSQNVSRLRSDGTILLNNQPFFPFGAYGIHWTQSDADQMQGLEAMATAGFNLMVVEQTSRAGFNVLVDAAANKQVYLSVSTPYPPNLVGTIQNYKNKSNILWWGLADDGDDGRFTLTELNGFHSTAKATDPTRLTYLTLTGFNASRRNSVNNFTPIADVAALQIYPIGAHRNYDVTPLNALTVTYLRTLSYVLSATALNKPMVMNLQTFNWNTQSDSPRYPTVLELRNMLYSGLAAGVKGILFYDFSFDLMNQQVPLWNELKTLRADVNVLQNALMNGTLTRLSTGDPELVASRWIDAQACYIVLINTSYSNTKNVMLSLPSEYQSSNALPIFPRMPATMLVSAGALAGSISPQGVQVYKLYATTPAPTGLQLFRRSNNLDDYGAQDALKPAGDGTTNLLKFAFNMIGNSVGQASSLSFPNAATLLANGSAGLPRVSTDAAGKLQLTHVRRKAASNSGITYTVEFSSTLAAGSWAVNDAATIDVASIDTTFERVTVTDNLTQSKRFVRVKIVTP